MARKIFAMLLCVMISTAMMGQTYTYGMKFGLSRDTGTTSSSTESVDNGWQTGFHLGGYGNLHFNKHWEAEFNIFVSFAGNKETVVIDTNNKPEKETKYNYNLLLDLPLLAKYYVIDDLFVELGPQFSLYTRRDNDDHLYEKFDVGIVGGIGYNIIPQITVDLRFTRGFMNREATYSKVKSLGIELLLAYRIGRY